jgi:hypothetical protein
MVSVLRFAKTACDETFGPHNIVTVSTRLVVRVQLGRAATAASTRMDKESGVLGSV